ncbi:uncharacterized protein [Haliotis cracherodii]|uniref:uncharacterized protein n=1 Tax=Haliotis cracherodii TaxID=6455 RepID=UPI0039E988DD
MRCQYCVLVLLTLSDAVSSSQKDIQIDGCSFKSGECSYTIQLSNIDRYSCKSMVGQPLGRSMKELLGVDAQAQNDVVTKVDSIKENFEQVKEKHEVRIKELENSVQELLGTDKRPYDTRKTVPNLTGKSASRDRVLSGLTRNFEQLREEIKRKEHALLQTELRLNETRKTLNDAQLEVININQRLLHADNKIASLTRERSILKNQLKDRTYRLGKSEKSLNESTAKAGSLENRLLGVIRSENIVSEDLATCRVLLNESAVNNLNGKTRYSELRRRHDVTKHELKIRERELINCYSAKTAAFCGFEDPYNCGFIQTNDTDVFNWKRAKGSTPSGSTGPSKDHTCDANTGHFMYIEASAKARGNNAIIYSPLYRGMDQQCVGFHYHMYGRHVGTLNVYAKARGFQVTSVWRAFGNQGDWWIIARLAIPKQLARAGYQIAFEGITEKGYQGDIAIDDISVEDGPCPVDSNAVAVVVKVDTSELDKEGMKLTRKARKGRKKNKKSKKKGRKRKTAEQNKS